MSNAISQSQRILIVGGGPSGLMLAIILASQNSSIDILVIDKKNWPINKICGQGIMPSGIRLLKKYNIIDDFTLSKVTPFYGIRYINNNGDKAEGKFKNNLYGIGIERIILSEILFNKAKKFTNIKLENNSKLVNLISSQDDRKFIAVVEKNNEKTTLNEFDIIIGADGIHSPTRKFANLISNYKIPLIRIGCRFHYDVKPWSNLVEVYWNNNIEVYVTPVSENKIELAFLWNKEQLNIELGTPLLPQFLNLFPQLKHKLASSTAIEKFQSIGPLYSKSKNVINKNVILIGDAYYFYDAITAEGISLGFKQAELWANILIDNNFDINKINQNSRYINGKIVNEIIKPYNRITTSALLLNKFPTLRIIVIKIFQLFPFIFNYLLNSKVIVE